MQLTDFIVNQWQYDDRNKTNPNIFYATAGAKSYNLPWVGMTEVSSFSTSQEEVVTRMFLHVQYVLNNLQGNIINSSDTDVFISLMVSEKINANINSKISNQNKARIISVN